MNQQIPHQQIDRIDVKSFQSALFNLHNITKKKKNGQFSLTDQFTRINPNQFVQIIQTNRFDQENDSLAFTSIPSSASAAAFVQKITHTPVPISSTRRSAYLSESLSAYFLSKFLISSFKDVGVHRNDHDVSPVCEARASPLQTAAASDAGFRPRTVHLSRCKYNNSVNEPTDRSPCKHSP